MSNPQPAEQHATAEAFRPDLEGLRGLAILLVLLFHAGVPGIAGGFVGVDVFFVLSGFLITGLLIRERERTGRIDLPAFYARRARRILPAALVVIVATLVAATAFLSPLDLLRTADDAVAVALSAGNIRFAATATDYFAGTAAPSPFLHYWSLGVEEQFYLLWPALLIVATRYGRPRLGAGVLIAAVVVTSVGLAIWLTDVSAPWAFYSLPTRAWQLGLGGLLAIVIERVDGRGRLVAAGAGWLGLAAVIASAFVIDASTPYPGVAALLPALGAGGLIIAGTGRASAGRLLALAPMRFLGRISYSLYLVHWPILVLPAATLSLDEELPLAVRLVLAGLSLVVGAACWRVVEQPIHRAVRFRLQPWRALGIATAAVATTLVAVFAVSAGTSESLDSALMAAPVESAMESIMPDGSPAATAIASDDAPTDAPAYTSTPTREASPSPIPPASEPVVASLAPSAPSSFSLSAAAPSPVESASSTEGGIAAGTPGPTPGHTTAPTATPAPTAAPTTPPATAPVPPTPTALPATAPTATAPAAPASTPRPTSPPPDPNSAQPLPANVQPPLRTAVGDRERLQNDGCELGNTRVQPPSCIYGNRNGAFTLALVGDSHAAQWFPALEVIADRNGWRLVVFTKISCRFVDLPIYSRELKREYTECAQWRELVVGQLQATPADLIVVSAARGMGTINPADDSPVRQGAEMARLLNRVPGRKAILVDTPQSHVDVPGCLSSHISDTRPCDTSRSAAVGWRYLKLEQAAAEGSGAAIINMTDDICRGNVCPAVVDGYIVFRDVFHLTATFAASLADRLEPHLLRAAAE